MKAKLLTQGNDGREHFEVGATYSTDSEWVRRMLVNGLAEPMDAEAKAVVADKDQQSQHKSAALSAAAKELTAKPARKATKKKSRR